MYDKIRYNYELDLIIANVMPDDWEGHQRIRNYEMFYEE